MSIGHHISSDGIDRYIFMPLMAIITLPRRSPEKGCDVVEYDSIHKISFRFQKTTK